MEEFYVQFDLIYEYTKGVRHPVYNAVSLARRGGGPAIKRV